MNLLNMAKKSVDIVSSHWDLNHTHPSACQVSHILYFCDGFICIIHSYFPDPHKARPAQFSNSTFPQSSWTVMCLCIKVDVPSLVIRHSATQAPQCFFQGKIMFHLCLQEALCRMLPSHMALRMPSTSWHLSTAWPRVLLHVVCVLTLLSVCWDMYLVKMCYTIHFQGLWANIF